jgi:hypothetical protein
MPGWLEDQIPSFFNANAKPDEPMSQKALEARRELVKAIMSRRPLGYPKNVGEGLTALGEGIGDRMQMNRLEAAERARDAGLVSGSRTLGLPGTATAAPPAAGAPVQQRTAPPPAQSVAPAPRAEIPPEGAPAAVAQTDETPPVDDATRIKLAAALMPDEQPGGRPVPFTTASGDQPAAQEPTAESAISGPVPLPPRRPVYDRNRQIDEMNADPTLKPRMLAMAQGENPKNLGVQLASLFNRANARDQRLEQVLRDTATSPRSGYYPAVSFTRGQAPESALTDVLRGADVGGPELGFSPTGNASGQFAADRVKAGIYNTSGKMPGDTETYVQQETPAQLANLERTRVPGTPYAPPENAQAAITQALKPVQMAQAARSNAPIVTPDIQPAPRGPAPGSNREVPNPLSAPVPRTEPPPIVATTKSGPPPVAPEYNTKLTDEEIRGWNYVNRFPGDSERAAQAAPLIKWGQDKRQKDYERDVKLYDKQLEIWTKKVEAENEAGTAKGQAEQAKLVDELSTADAKRIEEAQYGPGGKTVVRPAIEKSLEGVKEIPTAMESIYRAQDLLNKGIFTGSLAQWNIFKQKFAAATGLSDERQMIERTEQFRSELRLIQASLRAGIAGGQNQNPAEMKAVEQAAGLEVLAEAGSLKGVLASLAHRNLNNAVNHQERVTAFVGNNENARRLDYPIYSLPMEKIVPQASVVELRRRLAEKPDEAAAIMKEYDEDFNSLGLARKVLRYRR